MLRQIFRRSIASSRLIVPSYIPRHHTIIRPSFRYNSSSSDAPKSTPIGQIKVDKPSYHLQFTCKKCDTRSTHTISKQGYHHGTVLAQCPSCKNRHLIADHLKIFSDKSVTLEDILKNKGESVTRGTISQRELDGNLNGDLVWEGNGDEPMLIESKKSS